MSKLSKPMSDALSDLASYGVFQEGTRKATITALVSRGLAVLTSDGDYRVTDDGYAELGTTKPVTLTADASDAVNHSDGAPLADWEAELIGINSERPYVVQQYRNGIWYNVPGMEYRTWGTASVKRNQRHARYVDAVCRVVNLIEDRICA